jgi:LuxR family transcriptional regulator, maltose regulon positive regulatory protein
MENLAKPPAEPLILKTKLFIPQVHEDLVERPRLMLRLNEILHRSLLLLSAPAGSGKTTLLADWLARSQLQTGWISLDKRDNDPQRFWIYVIAALQTIQPTVGKPALALLQTPQLPPIENILIDVLNDAAAISSEFLLVFDDYHVIESKEIEQAMAFFLENLPPQMHVILASRSEPALPLSKMRARRKLVEIGSIELNFTSEEAAALLNEIMKLNLNKQDIQILESATEGWAAGLHLAALALQSMPEKPGSHDIHAFASSFSGGHHFLFDYLGQEILERQPQDIQQFLMQTSILERFTASVCEVVLDLEAEASIASMENLRKANLFLICLDEERKWFRYHPLFSGFLRKRLEARLPDEKIVALHRRASEWFGRNGLHAEAVDHALAAEDFHLAANWIDQAAEDMFVRSQLITLLEWLDSLPEAVIKQYSRLNMVYSWALLATARAPEIEPHLQAIEENIGISLAEAARLPSFGSLPAKTKGILAEVACIRANLSFNHFQLQDVLNISSQVKELLDQDVESGLFNEKKSLLGVSAFSAALAHEYSGNTPAAIESFIQAIEFSSDNYHLLPLAYSHLAQLQIIHGNLHKAEAAYQMAFQAGEAVPYTSPLEGLAYSGMGRLMCERNQLELAEAHLTKGLELGRTWNQWEILTEAYTGLAHLEIIRRNPGSAQALLEQMMKFAKNTQAEWIYSSIEMLQALYAARANDLPRAAAWLEAQTSEDPEGPIPYLAEGTLLVQARIALALNNTEKALTIINSLIPAAEEGKRWGRVIEALVYQARALVMTNQRSQALATLERALTLAEPQGYLRIFLDAGEEVLWLLDDLKSSASAGKLHQYIHQLMEAASLQNWSTGFIKTRETPDSAVTSSELPQLSQRELQVLRLVAEGKKNQEISETLYISLNTVKTHLKKILHTLGVENRTQASARARELGLL